MHGLIFPNPHTHSLTDSHRSLCLCLLHRAEKWCKRSRQDVKVTRFPVLPVPQRTPLSVCPPPKAQLPPLPGTHPSLKFWTKLLKNRTQNASGALKRASIKWDWFTPKHKGKFSTFLRIDRRISSGIRPPKQKYYC